MVLLGVSSLQKREKQCTNQHSYSCYYTEPQKLSYHTHKFMSKKYVLLIRGLKIV